MFPFLAFVSSALVVALLVEAFERGAGRRFPALDRLVSDLAWIVAFTVGSAYLITFVFVALALWG